MKGNIYRDVLLEALLADDDNADLSDGTLTTWQSWKLLQNMVSPCWLMQK